jgi:ParB-like chromosome segregation protein Spo0J
MEARQLSFDDIKVKNQLDEKPIKIAENILITEHLDKIISILKDSDLDSRIEYINLIRECIHNVSPFKDNPVDLVRWVKNKEVKGNEYNPNVVAPPEMELLRLSIESDGYTQPIVTWDNEDQIEVIDGFHRHRVGKECKIINERVHGYLPVVGIREKQEDKNNRIASTIRHNRARGKHTVDSMSDIILELKARNWKNKRIAKELGMDEDEILRLCQITGLADVFSDEEFSRSWDIENAEQPDFVALDEFTDFDESEQSRTVNTSDETRVFHKWEDWECQKAGFYKNTYPGKTKKECEEEYAGFLSDIPRFENAMDKVINEWVKSSEHYLTNQAMNRIAWMGQASMCCDTGIPSVFCGGFNLLSEQQQKEADEAALKYINKWLEKNDREPVTMEQANPGRQATIY